MTPQREFDCAACGRRIGKTASHRFVNDALQVACTKCMLGLGSRGTQDLHAKFYPDCPTRWHDMYDHRGIFAPNRRAASAYAAMEGRDDRLGEAQGRPK